MKKEILEKIQKNILINGIILFGIILFFLGGYIFYKIFLTGKIYNNISKNIDYFIEFELKNFGEYKDFLGKNQPFFSSYLDKISFRKGAIIFYEGEKISALLSGSERKSKKFLEKISIEKNVKKEGKFLISKYSPAPDCIQSGNNLFCGKKEILEKFISDIERGEILKKDKKFLKVENNLQIAGNFIFGYANLGNEKDFPLISEKFISGGFSFWKKSFFKKNSEIEGIFYGNFRKDSGEIFYEKKKNINLEKYFNENNTIFLAYSRDLSEKMKKYFEYYSAKNQEITEIGKNILEEKKGEFKLFLEQNFGGKIIFENPEEDVFILFKDKTGTGTSDAEKNNEQNDKKKGTGSSYYFSEKNYSDEKIFINLEKIREIFGLNYLENFNFLTGYSKNFDDGIQIKIEIK